MFAMLMGLKTISPEDLHRRAFNRDHLSVFDVNSSQSWMKGHVPGAVHLDPVTSRTATFPPTRTRRWSSTASNPMCRKAPNAARRANGSDTATCA
jgi:hypothetical protein